MPPIYSDVVIPVHDITASGGVIVRWHKADGAFIATKEVLLTIETDKVNLEVVAEKAGKLQIKLREGERIAAGTIVAFIDTGAQPPISAPAIEDDSLGKASTRGRKRPKPSASKEANPLDFAALVGLPSWPADADPESRPIDFAAKELEGKKLDIAAQLGLPDFTEAQWEAMVREDKPLVKKPRP